MSQQTAGKLPPAVCLLHSKESILTEMTSWSKPKHREQNMSSVVTMRLPNCKIWRGLGVAS